MEFMLRHRAGEVFKDPHRFRVLVAGRRFGKTMLLYLEALRAVNEAAIRQLDEVWYLAPTYRQAKEIMWEVVKSHTHPDWLVGKPNETELSVQFSSGVKFKLKGTDNPDSLRGKGLWMALFDEFDFMDRHVWPRVIRPMLLTTKGRAIFVGTPDGFANLYDYYYRGQSNKPNDVAWKSWQFTTVDGGWVDPDEVDEAREDMDERTFEQEFMAKFCNMTGKVYYAFDRAHNVREVPDGLLAGALAGGMDFNVDPMSCVIFCEDAENTYVVDCITIKSSNTFEMVQEIRRRYGNKVVSMYPDPAGKQRKTSARVGYTDHKILQEAGFRVYSKNYIDSVRDGVNAVNARFRSVTGVRRLFIDPKAKALIDALERHTYKDGTNIPKQDEFVHLCDALRYPVEYLHPIKRFERKLMHGDANL